MCIRDSNGETVYIYARMVEINSEGIEIPRPDLTQKISIFSHNEFLNISPAIFQGDYMGSSVEAFAENPAIMPEEAVISFKYIGEGGTFQNNVKFQMVGDCYIEVEGGKVFALADSGQSFEHPYKLIDFLNNVEDVIINNIDGNSEFDLSLGKDKNGNTIIIVSDHSQKRNTESFYCNYKCEIIAKNEKEFARTTFNVVLCYEGILPDFLGKKKEIAAYMNDQDEMLETIVAVRLGTWDETKKNLNIRRPDSAEVSFSDDENIFEVVGLEIILDEERSTSDYSLYVFRAEKSLPASESIKGKLLLIYPSETCSFESETDVEMIPDLLEYEKEREKEYQNCIRIIDTYLPINFRAKKHHELDASKDIMGIKDFQLFRKKCWEIASRCILQEKESYLIESYWYDEAIATAELVVFIGDSALDVALAPFGGPITGFVISQVKSSFIELVSMRIEKGTIGYSEIFDLIKNRLQQMAGQADGLIETPGYNKPKVLVAWLTSYILYRIMYHWYYDMDQETNEPKGLFEAVQSGLVDFAGKGISILLGEYAKDIADTRGISADTALEQEWVNKQVEKGAKKGLDAMGKMAESLDKKISEICAVIMDYIDKIRSGKV